MTAFRGNSHSCGNSSSPPCGVHRKTGRWRTNKNPDRVSLTEGPSTLLLVQGDITQQDTQAIVNAANSGLLGGGGVDGAIHRAGGPQILKECRKIREESGECPTGMARVTGGGNLPARFVIHAVGPVWKGGRSDEDALLASAYRESLGIAQSVGAASVSFPCISTGAYGFPADRAAAIAFRTVRAFVRIHRWPAEVRFVVYSGRDFRIYQELFSQSLE